LIFHAPFLLSRCGEDGGACAVAVEGVGEGDDFELGFESVEGGCGGDGYAGGFSGEQVEVVVGDFDVERAEER